MPWVLALMLSLIACGQQPQQPAQPARVRVGKDELFGRLELTLEASSRGSTLPAQMTIRCEGKTGIFYVDTQSTDGSPPSLHGVYAEIDVDGGRWRPELGWGGPPGDTWLFRSDVEAGAIAKSIFKARQVRFVGPEKFGGGDLLTFDVDLDAKQRAALLKSCKKA